MRLALKGLSTADLRRTLGAAQISLQGFELATTAHGSLIQSWVGGAAIKSLEHYPPSDVIDRRLGAQFFYHCHRDNGLEHGHVHLFAHATRSGRRRYLRGEQDQCWTRSAPSHLIAIGLDARGLPVSLFLVNRWVTDGHWLESAAVERWLGKLPKFKSPQHAHACQWLCGFLAMYRPVIALLLKKRDAWAARQGDLEKAMTDRTKEVICSANIDWAADLQRLEAEITLRQSPPTC